MIADTILIHVIVKILLYANSNDTKGMVLDLNEIFYNRNTNMIKLHVVQFTQYVYFINFNTPHFSCYKY